MWCGHGHGHGRAALGRSSAATADCDFLEFSTFLTCFHRVKTHARLFTKLIMHFLQIYDNYNGGTVVHLMHINY